MSDTPDKSIVAAAAHSDAVRLKDVFSSTRIQVRAEIGSIRCLLDQMATLFIGENHQMMNKSTIFRSLIERERLGSTCVGNGVMIPHCRLNSLPHPIGAVVTMATPLDVDVDEDDGSQVSIACGILVPADTDSSVVHTKILGKLAEGFAEHNLFQQLMNASDENELFANLVKFDEQVGELRGLSGLHS